MNRVEIRYTESNILYHETIIFTLTLFLTKREIEKDAIRLIRRRVRAMGRTKENEVRTDPRDALFPRPRDVAVVRVIAVVARKKPRLPFSQVSNGSTFARIASSLHQ